MNAHLLIGCTYACALRWEHYIVHRLAFCGQFQGEWTSDRKGCFGSGTSRHISIGKGWQKPGWIYSWLAYIGCRSNNVPLWASKRASRPWCTNKASHIIHQNAHFCCISSALDLTFTPFTGKRRGSKPKVQWGVRHTFLSIKSMLQHIQNVGQEVSCTSRTCSMFLSEDIFYHFVRKLHVRNIRDHGSSSKSPAVITVTNNRWLWYYGCGRYVLFSFILSLQLMFDSTENFGTICWLYFESGMILIMHCFYGLLIG